MQPQHERREHSSVAFLLALSGDARLHTPTGEWTMGANDLLIVSDLRSVVLHEASARLVCGICCRSRRFLGKFASASRIANCGREGRPQLRRPDVV